MHLPAQGRCSSFSVQHTSHGSDDDNSDHVDDADETRGEAEGAEEGAPLGADVEARRVEVRAALASWRRRGAESMVVVVVVGEEEVRGRLGRRTVHVRR